MKKLCIALIVLFGLLSTYSISKHLTQKGEIKMAVSSGGGGWGNEPDPTFQQASSRYGSLLAPSSQQPLVDFQTINQFDPNNMQTIGPTAEEQVAAAAAARQAAARQGVFDEKQGYLDSAGGQINQYGQRYGNSITDYLDSLTSGQRQIDTAGAKNELARNQGQAGVLGMVGRGIKSTGVMLGNKNAGDSSAAGALAGAYGELGQRQMSNVGNQYELGNMDIANQQTTFDASKGKGKRDLELGKQEFVTGLVNETQSKMAELNARLIDASLPDRIAIEQEKQSIRDRANGALQQFDQHLTTGFQNIGPSSMDQRRSKAQELQQMGTDLGKEAFNFTQQAPINFQGINPNGGIPLFTLPRRRQV